LEHLDHKVKAYHKQPKTLKSAYLGILLYKIPKGDLEFKTILGVLFIRNTTVLTHSPQNFKGTLE